jgi:hypothetical protein
VFDLARLAVVDTLCERAHAFNLFELFDDLWHVFDVFFGSL